MKKCVILLMIAVLLSGCSTGKNVETTTEESTEAIEEIVATEEELADGMERFEAKGGFSVVYPDEWVVHTGDNVGGIEGCEFYVAEPESQSNISIAVYPFDPYINEMTKEMIAQEYAEMGIIVEVHEFFRGIRHGMKTVEMKYTVLGNMITQISFVDDDVYYNLVYTKKEGITEENEAVMQKIIDSVKKNG